jgi:hypothetical protein
MKGPKPRGLITWDDDGHHSVTVEVKLVLRMSDESGDVTNVVTLEHAKRDVISAAEGESLFNKLVWRLPRQE